MDYVQFSKRLLFNRGVGVHRNVGREEALWVDLKVEQALKWTEGGGEGASGDDRKVCVREE